MSKFLNYFTLLLYKSPMSAVWQNFEKNFEEQLPEIDQTDSFREGLLPKT